MSQGKPTEEEMGIAPGTLGPAQISGLGFLIWGVSLVLIIAAIVVGNWKGF